MERSFYSETLCLKIKGYIDSRRISGNVGFSKLTEQWIPYTGPSFNGVRQVLTAGWTEFESYRLEPFALPQASCDVPPFYLYEKVHVHSYPRPPHMQPLPLPGLYLVVMKWLTDDILSE